LIARLDIFSTVRQKELEITIQSSLFGKKPVKKKPVRQKNHWVQKPTGYGHIQWIKNETNRLDLSLSIFVLFLMHYLMH
jgi:hypothetical protein